MKKISTVLTSILASSMLFTACSKNDRNVGVSPAATTASKSLSPAINFESGGIEATDILVHSGKHILYRNTEPGAFDLFTNASSALRINPRHYEQLVIRVGATSTDRMNFWLRDEIVMEDGETIPLVFSIDEPFTLRTLHDVYAVNDNTRILDLMNIRADILGDDITMDMIMNAQRVDDVIMISREWNADLYVVLRDRLSTMTDISFAGDNPAGPVTPPTATPVPAPTAAM